jgi:prepilin-type processing-associated H-X9-DG protein
MTIIETTRDLGPWAAGGPSTVRGLDPQIQPYIGSGGQFGGSHTDGAYASFADGSVRFMKWNIAPEVFEAFITLADRGDKP